MLSLVFTLAAKDWRLFWADRRAAILCFAVPIVLASVFGMLFDKAGQPVSGLRLPLVVVVEDDGTFTQAVLADLLASPRVDVKRVTRSEAEHLVGDCRPGIAVVFPPGFERALLAHPSDSKPSIEFLHNPLCQAEAQWAEGIVAEIVMKRIAKTTLGSIAGERATELPYRAEVVPVSESNLASFNSYSHSFSGMTVQYLLFWGMESGLMLLRERNRSVWMRTRAAPVSLTAVLLGKSVATGSIAMIQIFATFLFGRIVFGVSIAGSWTGFIALTFAISLLAAATGLLVAAIGGTEGRARSISILVILGVSMLGGLWIPAFLLPGWARELALALPTTWAMRGLDAATWQGRDLFGTLPNVVAVFGFAAVFLAIAGMRFAVSESRKRKGFA